MACSGCQKAAEERMKAAEAAGVKPSAIGAIGQRITQLARGVKGMAAYAAGK